MRSSIELGFSKQSQREAAKSSAVCWELVWFGVRALNCHQFVASGKTHPPHPGPCSICLYFLISKEAQETELPPKGLMGGWEEQENGKTSSPLSCEAFIRDANKILHRISPRWKLTTGMKGTGRALGQHRSDLHQRALLVLFPPPPNSKS